MTKKEFFLGLAFTIILLTAFFAFFVKPKYGPQIEKVKENNKQQESLEKQQKEDLESSKK